jgi:hypothetical protein
MMLEVLIPEPGAFCRAARPGQAVNVNARPPIRFLNDLTPMPRIVDATHWTEESHAALRV